MGNLNVSIGEVKDSKKSFDGGRREWNEWGL